MFSTQLKEALEKEIVGQPRAINNVVRGATRVVSGLTPHERSLCAYLFIGPTGTGKSHTVRTLARILHGDDNSRLAVADCAWGAHGDPWMSFVTQLAPLFSSPPDAESGVVQCPPCSIFLVEGVETGPKELSRTLGRALASGQLMLPHGKRGVLRNCLVFLTSSLCSREILEETSQIGFHGSIEEEDEDSEHDKIHQLCRQEAEKQFGLDLLGQLDGLVVLRRLEEGHLAEILDRRFSRLEKGLLVHGVRCELRPAAREFLLEKGCRHMRLGARDLIVAHRKFVEFPMADLLVSHRIPPGGLVTIDRKPAEEHLHFQVTWPGRLDPAAAREVMVS